MTYELFWKNFNLGTELQIAGKFIYNGIYTFDEMESFHFEEEIFEFLYNISVGIERLMKIVIILSSHDKKNIDQKSFEDKLKNHNHSKLMQMVREYHKLNLGKPHFELLKLLENFYSNMRYDRFNFGNVRNYDKEKKAFEYFLSQYLDVPINNKETLFITNINNNQIKKRMGNLIGKISTLLYNAIREECFRLGIYTYEIRYNSKAYKIFIREEFDFTNEHNYWKEILIFLLNDSTQHEIKEIIQSIEPLNFDDALIPDYISHFKSHLKKLSGLDEMEYLHEELVDSLKQRLQTLKFLDNTQEHSVYEKSPEKDKFKDIINLEEAKERGEYHNLDTVENCDICRKILKSDKYIIDGKTKKGPWAWMCADCFDENGVGIKWGTGQLYQKVRNKWLLVAGYDSSDLDEEDF